MLSYLRDLYSPSWSDFSSINWRLNNLRLEILKVTEEVLLHLGSKPMNLMFLIMKWRYSPIAWGMSGG
jgi:hypothetical protein